MYIVLVIDPLEGMPLVASSFFNKHTSIDYILRSVTNLDEDGRQEFVDKLHKENYAEQVYQPTDVPYFTIKAMYTPGDVTPKDDA